MAKQNLGRVVGLSAYEVWLQQGNEGTEQDYLDSLKGEKGADGHTPVKGEDYFTEEEIGQIIDTVKPQVVVGDVTEASIMMADNVNVQLTEPVTQLFLEFPEEIEIGYRSEITFTMDENEMTFYPDLEYDGDMAWYGQYVSNGRPYISLGSKYHIVFTYDINGMKAVINGDEYIDNLKEELEEEYQKNTKVFKWTLLKEDGAITDQNDLEQIQSYINTYLDGEPCQLDVDVNGFNLHSLADVTTSTEIRLLYMSSRTDYSFSDDSTDSVLAEAIMLIISFDENSIVTGTRQVKLKQSNSFLATNVNYTVPYKPLYDGSPATKKYADDTLKRHGIYVVDFYKYNESLFGLNDGTIRIQQTSELWNILQDIAFGDDLEHKIIFAKINNRQWGIFYGNRTSTSQFRMDCEFIYDPDGDTPIYNLKFYSTITIGMEIQIYRKRMNILTTNNTTSYEVVNDYNPAHKKYVDDTIATLSESIENLEDKNIYVVNLPTENVTSPILELGEIFGKANGKYQEDKTNNRYAYILNVNEKQFDLLTLDCSIFNTTATTVTIVGKMLNNNDGVVTYKQYKFTYMKYSDTSFSVMNMTLTDSELPLGDDGILYLEMGSYGPLSIQNGTITPTNELYEPIYNYTMEDRPVKQIFNISSRTMYIAVSSGTGNVTTYKSDSPIQSYSGEYYTGQIVVNHAHGTNITMSSTPSVDLQKDNKLSYNVTHNYHPAHKKYVDDAIAAQVGNISTILETLTTVSEVSE